MRYSLIILFSLYIWQPLDAQKISLNFGKQFIVHAQTDQLSEITAMDQHTQLISEMGLDTRISIKSTSAAGYEMALTPLHIKIYMSRMGKEQQMDSDSATDRKNPALAPFLQHLDQTTNLHVDAHFNPMHAADTSSNTVFEEIKNDPGKYFLLLPEASLKRGFQWTDSVITKDSKYKNRYLIMQFSDSTVELSLTREMSSDQTGVHVKGFGTATRIYNRVSGILISEIEEMDLVGNSETAGMNFPLTIKIKRKIKVSPEN